MTSKRGYVYCICTVYEEDLNDVTLVLLEAVGVHV